MTKVRAITSRTDREWSADHPLRVGMMVVREDMMPLGHSVLVCSVFGEKRLPVPPGDGDVSGQCSKCPAVVVHRRSAPTFLPKVCWKCYGGMQ